MMSKPEHGVRYWAIQCGALGVSLIGLQSVSHEVVAQSKQETVATAGSGEGDVALMRDHFVANAAAFSFLGGPQGDEAFEWLKVPVLNWSNPERRTAAGGMFLWTLHGRPMVAMCGYPKAQEVGGADLVYDFEFQSLALAPFTAEAGGSVVWTPSQPGISFQSFADAPPPATSKAARLLQMRRLSREFSGKLVPPNRTEIPLRMLASPIFQYPLPTDLSDYVDGAVFALAQATDPEVLLQIEAVVDEDGKSQWRYALSRMSMVPTEVRHLDTLVWQTDWAVKNRSTPYFVLQRGMSGE